MTLPSGKAVVASGPSGRSAVTGHTVTVFGGSSFLGRYLVPKIGRSSRCCVVETANRLHSPLQAKFGTQVVLPYRDEYSVRHLKPCGDLGQIIPLEFDLRNPQSIAEAVRHSDIVYNLIGRDHETKYGCSKGPDSGQ